MKSAFKIIRICAGTVGLLLFLWFFVPGLITGGFHIGTVTGLIISLLFVLYAFFAVWIHRGVRAIWKVIPGRIFLLAAITAVAAILVLAVMCMICMGRGMSNAPQKEKTVVVLGCRAYENGPSLMLRSRLDAAYIYLEGNPDSDCIVCGGQEDRAPVTEAQVMSDYLVRRGIDPSRIYPEDKSEDTLENLSNALEIIKAEGLDPECVIVTSDYHCYRAAKYAQHLGYPDISTMPADTLWWLFPSCYIREMYGILEMWFLN